MLRPPLVLPTVAGLQLEVAADHGAHRDASPVDMSPPATLCAKAEPTEDPLVFRLPPTSCGRRAMARDGRCRQSSALEPPMAESTDIAAELRMPCGVTLLHCAGEARPGGEAQAAIAASLASWDSQGAALPSTE